MKEPTGSDKSDSLAVNIGSLALMVVMVVLIYDPSLFFKIVGIFKPAGKSIVRSTKVKLAKLNMALQQYRVDLGSFPYDGEVMNIDSVERANNSLLGEKAERNILLTNFYPGVYLAKPKDDSEQKPLVNVDVSEQIYQARWKGPYLKGEDAKDPFIDSWGTRIFYTGHDDFLCLHSAGPDKKFDPIDQVATDTYEGDDLLNRIAKIGVSLSR